MDEKEKCNKQDEAQISKIGMQAGRYLQAVGEFFRPRPVEELLAEEAEQIEKKRLEEMRNDRINIRGGVKTLVFILYELEKAGKIDHVTDKQAAKLFTINGKDVTADTIKQTRARDLNSK